MKRLILFLIVALGVVVFVFSSQSKPEIKEIRISTNPWIGYTPFMYAQEKGWLNDTRFKFIWTVGLDENSRLFESGLTKGFTTTQYELFNLRDKERIKPFFLIDKSSGADVILSNRSIKELKTAEEKVNAHFELISVNKDIFKAFCAKYYINRDKFTLHNSDQSKILSLKADKNSSLLISYEPYATMVEKNGYKRISSTKDLDNIQVVDAFFIEEKVGMAAKGDIIKLKSAFDRGVAALQNDPEEYYESIKGYLQNQSYEEFMASTKGIEWLNINPPSSVVEYLRMQGVGVDRLLK